MADFRQLALEFVLADEEGQQTVIARKAAKEIETVPANTNPVARWVEAVQPWMPGSQGDEREDGHDTPDWTARARALEFLSRTLDFLSKEVLKPSQVKLLIGFFGAMFEVDHKAGIMPSANALSRIAVMKSFQPTSGYEIIQKVCALKDDFPRQVSKTRLTIYELLRSLVSKPEVAKDLQRRYGDDAGFMDSLLQLCRSERDPDCLMVWFDTLRFFLAEYAPAARILEEVYSTFKSYFPIALPRASQSGITPEELKLQLRKCFSANSKLSPHTIAFLIAKLDQGDGVTVNVKVDILKTLKACLEEYSNPEESIVPHANKIWDSLKYEVRNGEIEDTIWGTLEVLKTLTTRLQGDSLRDFVLNITRDCVNDLTNSTYTAPAGRLLISVLSAKPSAFVSMASPIVTHVKENLRHPKAPAHSQDLHRILHVILETRILLVESEMDVQDRDEFSAVDTVFRSLYDDVYKATVKLGSKPDASYDEIKITTHAVQGAGALICQRPTKSQIPIESGEGISGLLLPGNACGEICEALFSITGRTTWDEARSDDLDNLINEATKALQRAVRAYTPAFRPLVDQALQLIRSSWKPDESTIASEKITALGSTLAYAGCSELPHTRADGLNQFIYLITAISQKLFEALDSKADPKVWCAFAAILQTTVRYFNDVCHVTEGRDDAPFDPLNWVETMQQKYPGLSNISSGNVAAKFDKLSSEASSLSLPGLRNEFLFISLFIARQLYRRATQVIETHAQTGNKALSLSNDFTGADQSSEYQYLYLISGLAGFVIHEMDETQQASLQGEKYAVNLFQDDFINIPQSLASDHGTSEYLDSVVQSGSRWSWLVSGQLNVLSLGVLEALRPSAIIRLFDTGVAQELVLSGCFAHVEAHNGYVKPAALSILTILANKYKIEDQHALIQVLNEQSASLLKLLAEESEGTARADRITSIFAIAAGMLRRYAGKQAQDLLHLVREAPKDVRLGQQLGRRLEMLVVPQRSLTKENYAIVKPLWMQKVYFQLISPMLQTAIGSNAEVEDASVKANYSTGVLLMVKHMNFAIYEDDADKILRISIAIAQSNPNGTDTKAALDVLKNILVEAPEKGQGHLRSIINICVASFSAKPDSGAGDFEVQAGCGKLALEIIGGLPRLFESRHLVSQGPQVQRALNLACGHRVRDLRKTARLARAAWVDLK